MARERQRRHEGARRNIARLERRQRAAQRSTRRRTLLFVGGAILALALASSLLLPSLPVGGGTPVQRLQDAADDDTRGTGAPVGTQVLLQPAQHIDQDQPHPPYSSTPPTSGWHFDTPAAWAIYAGQLPDEFIPHNLEHGGIVINHNLTDEAQVAQLTQFVEGQAGFPSCFIMQPYRNAPDAVPEGTVALTAWGWLQPFDGVDAAGMQAFINAHKNRGPEYLNSRCGG